MVPQVIPSTSAVLTVCKVMGVAAIASSVAGLIYVIWNLLKWPKEADKQNTDGQDISVQEVDSREDDDQADGNVGQNSSQDP